MKMVGLVGLEPTTPALSRRCSNQLSYRPFTQGAGRRSLTKPALPRHGGALPAHFDMLRSTTADKSGRSDSSALMGSARPSSPTLHAKSIDAVRRCHFPERR